MLNRTILMGRLVRDPELRRTGSGIAVASFTVACDRDFGPKDGGEKPTDFVDCTAWRATGEFVSKYFKKGSMIVVEGRLEQRHWTDKETGNKRSALEINVDNAYFGEGKKNDGQQGGYSAPAGGYGGGYAAPAPAGAPAPAYGGGYAAPAPAGAPAPAYGGGYAAPAPASAPAPAYGGGYAAPAPAPAPAANNYQGGGYQGNFTPAPPASDFAMLSDDDAKLPF